jgi:hypothetical protein
VAKNKAFMPGTVRDGRRKAPHSFYPECEAPNVSVALPLEYRKRDGSSPRAGVCGNLGERDLFIYSIFEDLSISQELKILVFFANGYRLDCIKLIAAVTWKRAHSEAGWKGYKYRLEVIHLSPEDREKLKLLLCNKTTDHMSHGESGLGRTECLSVTGGNSGDTNRW